MTNLARTESYFSSVAAGYQKASTNALWRVVRDREARALASLIGVVRGNDVLELGCGAGFYTRMLLREGARHVTAVDLSQPMLDQLPQGPVTPVLGDATTVKLDRRFDILLSAGMLEFVPDAAAALANAACLAHAHATMVVLYPVDSLLGRGYRRFHRSHGLTITLFSPADIRRLAEKTGWSVDATRAAGPYSACSRLIRKADH